jgi:hypothetical protein
MRALELIQPRQIGVLMQMVKDTINQSISSGDNSILVQAGRDAILNVTKSPPTIKLVRLTIVDDDTQEGLRQKLNIIIKNNGDRTAFLLHGTIVSTGNETIVNCNNVNTQFNLSTADWTYDLNIDDKRSQFVGQHAIAPNEVINFDIIVGRRHGGHELTIYRCFLRLEFDEGEPLETGSFHLQISGPTVPMGSYTHLGPTPDEWGRCMADNIRRLDKIGYDFRPQIDPDSAKYIEAVAPRLLRGKP